MLLARSFAGLTFLTAVMASVLLTCEGTLYEARAWMVLALFFGCAGIITLWLWLRDEALLERRVRAGPGFESDPVQRFIQILAGLAFLVTFAVSGLDRRFAWSHVPQVISLLGVVLIALGFLIVFLVFRENTFTAGRIELSSNQVVIDTGPYAVVRHPMYAGALVLAIGIPLALGSWWGCLAVVLLAQVIAWRLLREEAFLAANLGGYADYLDRIRYRLVPGVF